MRETCKPVGVNRCGVMAGRGNAGKERGHCWRVDCRKVR